MSKYGSVVDGKVLHWKWKKRELDYLFYVGDIYVGQLFYIKRLGWSALHREHNCVGAVHGFKCKLAASEFLLKFEPTIRKPE